MFINFCQFGILKYLKLIITYVEESVISRHHIKAMIFKIKAFSQSANSLSQLRMKGNVITFPQNPDKILSILPSASKSDLFQVAFITKARPNINLIKKIFRVR